jgi:hypothetical protein
MNKISFEELQKHSKVYMATGYGGLEAYDLKWGRDTAYCEGVFCDHIETLRDLFEVEELASGFYLTPQDWIEKNITQVEFSD